MVKRSELKIFVDDHEPSKVFKMCREAGLVVEKKRLKCGDFVCGDICIERKTINDFCSSIVDGRLKKQIQNMKDLFTHNYVIVSGFISQRESLDFHKHSILGMMASIMIKSGVSLVCVENDVQLIYLVERIISKHEELLNKSVSHKQIERRDF